MTVTINSVGHLYHNADRENLEVHLKNCPAGNFCMYFNISRKYFFDQVLIAIVFLLARFGLGVRVLQYGYDNSNELYPSKSYLTPPLT